MTAAAYVDPVLACGAILGALGFVGAGIGWAIQCHHTATEADRARKAERRAAHRGEQVLELIESANRLRSLLRHESEQHAERLADLVSVCGTDTAEQPHERTS